jgi:Tfp pilus assembly protein PilF
VSDYDVEQSMKDIQDLKRNCEMWLRPPNIGEVLHHVLQEKLAGTNEWILSHPTFLRWRDIPTDSSAVDRLLRISGTPGCGKSVLASSIVESMKSLDHKVLYFAFSGTDAGRQSLNSWVRSFLCQLLQESTSDKSFALMRDLMSQGQPLNSDLWNAFSKVASCMPESMYWVVDGIDECKEPTSAIIDQLTDLLNIHKKTRAILLGRQHAFGSVTSENIIEITPNLIKPDIDAFIHTQISKCTRWMSPDIRESAFKTLQNGSNGMFLWVKFVVADLNKSSSKAELIERLHNIPKGLQQTYRHLLSQILERLDDVDLKFAQRVLAFIIAARQPLSHNELQYAQAITSCSSSILPDVCSIEDHMVYDLAQRILNVYGSLVSVANGVVSLVHVSAKEFLTRRENEWACEDDHKIARLRLDPKESHRLLGLACLDYLSIGGYGFPLISDDPSTFWTRYTFLQYASKNMIYHFNRAGILSPGLIDRIRRFSKSEACLSWAEFFLIHLLEDESTGSDVRELEDFMSTLDRERHQISECFLVVLHRELDNRMLKFGDRDWRADQLRIVIDIVRHDGQGISMRPITTQQQAVNTDLDGGQNSHIPKVSEMMKVLNHGGRLPIPKKFDLLLKLEVLFRRTSVLTDSLELLFRMILQNAALFPIYTLMAIAGFYRKVNRREMALEAYHTALAKLRAHDTLTKSEICYRIGTIQHDLGCDREAEEMYRRAIKGYLKTLGPDHGDTLKSINNVGVALLGQGKLEEAETMLCQAMEGQMKTFGPEHAETLICINNVGDSLHDQRKFDEAETMFRQAMKGRMKTLGPKHADTLRSINSVGRALLGQEKFEEAETMYRQAMEDRIKILGPEHAGTLVIINNVGAALFDQGKLEEAETMLCQAMKGRMKTVGPEHAETLICINNMGVALLDQGKLEEAETMFRQAMEGRIRTLGPKHAGTLKSIYNLRLVLKRQRKYAEIERMDRYIAERTENR